MSERRLALDDGSLVDVLDRLLDVGAYLDGTVLLTLADVDLVRLDLRLLLASVDTLQRGSPTREADADSGASVRSGPPANEITRANGSTRANGTTRANESTRATAGPRVGRPHTSSRPESSVRAPRVRAAGDLSTAGSEGKDREAGIAGLVVVLVDIVRQLLERQALRRMDAGTLTDEQVERLGQALMGLERQVAELTDFVGSHRRREPGVPCLARFPGPDGQNSHR